MMSHGLRADQVAQVRGYADQHLRKPDAPEDPSNRRISILVKRAEPSPAGRSRPKSTPRRPHCLRLRLLETR
jgi:chemotaxis protein MotB